MKLLITQPVTSYFWLLEGRQVKKLHFRDYFDHDLCQPIDVIDMPLPWEISSTILAYLFQIYLNTFNFDLAADLLFTRKEFIKQIYAEIYPKALVSPTEKFRRILGTLELLETVHETYITVIRQRQYSVLKLVRHGDPSVDTLVNPWDFCFDAFIEPLTGIISPPGDPTETHAVGPCYGDQVWIKGRWSNGVFNCTRLATPIINIKFTDIFDSLAMDYQHLKSNPNFTSFFKLLKYVYGPNTAIHVMVREASEFNPFISHSNTFISY